MGAPTWQPVATARKWHRRESGKNKPKPLRSLATDCRKEPMVRRGSTARVRQRALQKPRKLGLLRSPELARSTACGGYGALMELQVENVPLETAKTASFDIGKRTFVACTP